MRLLCLLLLSVWGLFSQRVSERKLERWLSQVPAFEKAHLALQVESLSGKTHATYQGGTYMTPASNTKLFTFLGALQTFDSLAALYYAIEKDSLLHFKSTGYPLLLHPFYPDTTLHSFFSTVKKGYYYPLSESPNPSGAGWAWDDYPYYYAAESSSFPIYGNSTQAVWEATAPKLLPQFPVYPDSLVSRLERERQSNRFAYNPAAWKEKDTLYRPFKTSDSLFVRLLSEATNKEIAIATAPPTNLDWKPLYTHHEIPLYQGLLQDSDNGIAEALLLMIAEHQSGRMRTEVAIDTLQKQWSSWLPDPLEWVDGSGVSRYNMVTPRTLVALLRQIYTKADWETLQTLFPKSGQSGTLQAYADLKNVYAKTGSLRHNHNLSGYWVSERGNTYLFSVMVNHFTAPTVEIRKGITEVLTALQQKLK